MENKPLAPQYPRDLTRYEGYAIIRTDGSHYVSIMPTYKGSLLDYDETIEALGEINNLLKQAREFLQDDKPMSALDIIHNIIRLKLLERNDV